jgi:hypothetical protein
MKKEHPKEREGDTPFIRFERFMKKLLKVPKETGPKAKRRTSG